MRARLITAFFFLAIALGVFAQNEKPDILSHYDRQLFSYGYANFGGFRLTFRDQSASLDFGIPQAFAETVSTYSDSKVLIEPDANKVLAGNLLVWSGLGFILGGAILTVATGATSLNSWTTADDGALALVSYGIALDLIAGGVLSSAY